MFWRYFHIRLFRWPLAALVSGLVVTGWLVLETRQWVDEQLRAALDFDAHQMAARLQQQLALQEEALRGLTGLFVASDEVSRQDFRAYVGMLQFEERFPAVLSFRLAYRVTAQALPAWQQRVARSLGELGEAVPDLTPKPPGARDEYWLVEDVAPFSPASLGLDLLASSRRAALERLQSGQRFALSDRLAAEFPDFPA